MHSTRPALLRGLRRLEIHLGLPAPSGPASLTAERAGELLFRLEKEVYGEPRTRPSREAVVRLGLPMELADWLPPYRARRKRTVAQCTAEVEERLRTLLGSLNGVSTPL